MVWRRYPFESMWREMDALFNQVQTGGRLLPAESSGSMSGSMQMK